MPDIKDLVTNLGQQDHPGTPTITPATQFPPYRDDRFRERCQRHRRRYRLPAQSVSFASVTTNPPKRWSAYAMAMNLGAAQSGKNVLP